MITIAPKTRFAAAKKFLLALSFLAVLAVTLPSAHADDYYRHHRYYHHRYYHHGYGYYGPRHYRWVHGRRYYYYGGYYPGINLHIAL